MTLDAPELTRTEAPTFLTGGGEVGALMRRHDWTASPLGAPDGWPQSLRSVVGLLLNSKFPMFVAWGPELGFLYNDAYAEILGAKHPASLGARFHDIWTEIWPDISPLIDAAMAGQATYREDLPLLMNRKGFEEQTWFTFSYSPVRDESGAVAGMFCAVAETTDRVLGERREAEAKARQQRMFAQAPGFICTLSGPEHVFEFANDAYARLFGARNFVGRTVREVFPELEGQGFFETLDAVYETGERFIASRMPARLARADGAFDTFSLDFIYAPITDPNGRITGIFCEGFDVTEVHRAAEALADSEERLRLATDAAEVGFWDLDVLNDVMIWPPRVKAMFGISPDVPVSMADFYGGLHPDDRERVEAAFASAADPLRRALYDVDYRTIGKEDGLIRWVAAKGRGLFDAEGRCVRVIGTAIDITHRKRTEEHLRLMVNELNHRVKNTLATVQSITAQTLRGAELSDEVRKALTSRLMALASAHDVLTDERWRGADLRELLEQTAAPYAQLDGVTPIVVSGPQVYLPPKVSIALALAFHELATNAAKYGALSVEGGQVQVAWSLEPLETGSRLSLQWREVGGPRVSPPSRSGFGTRLIERGLSAELGGEVRLDFRPDGLVCTMQAVLADPELELDWNDPAGLI